MQNTTKIVIALRTFVFLDLSNNIDKQGRNRKANINKANSNECYSNKIMETFNGQEVCNLEPYHITFLCTFFVGYNATILQVMVVNVTVFFFCCCILMHVSILCMYIVKVQSKIEKKADRVYHEWKLAKEPFF